MKKRLGVFDSGLGGLTVVKELVQAEIYEEIIYLGDTGRVPYGTRSVETIIKYAKEDVNFLIEKNVTEIIVACGTVSSVAMNVLKDYCPVPIVGMITKTIIDAAKYTKNKKIGIIGTEAAINNKAFESGLKNIDNSIKIISASCPLFVSLVEYGFVHEKEIIKKTCEYYLKEMKNFNIDTLIMGCTHFPILKEYFNEYFENITLINMGISVISKLTHHEKNVTNTSVRYYVTDSIDNFIKNASIFYKGIDISNVKKVELKTII